MVQPEVKLLEAARAEAVLAEVMAAQVEHLGVPEALMAAVVAAVMVILITMAVLFVIHLVVARAAQAALSELCGPVANVHFLQLVRVAHNGRFRTLH